jgi:hypothetical protein
MIEYIFFEAPLRNAFIEYAESLGVVCTLQHDSMGLIVAVPEDIGEAKEDALEARYDELQEEQSQLLAEAEGGVNRLAGFRFSLPNGESRMVPLHTDVANRLLAQFNLDEIQALFDAVARSAVNPAEEHLCKVLAQEKARNLK